MEPGARIGVLHLISGLSLGGAERMLLASARTHDRARFRMGVVSLLAGGELAAPIREAGVPVHELGWRRGRMSAGGLRRLFRAVTEFSPRVLQGHMFHGNLLARLVGVVFPAMTVVSAEHMDRGHESPGRRLLDRLTAPLARGAVGYSPGFAVVERRRGLLRPARRLIPYGIELPPPPAAGRDDVRRGLGVPSGAFLFLAAGRLSPEKGFGDLVRAFALLPAHAAEGFLVFAGEGPERASLLRLAREAGVEGRVILAGARMDLPDLMAAADLFVLSSRWDGSPRVVLEAMASGLAVVATRVGTVGAMVEEGRTGLLVPPGRPDELAGAMARMRVMGEPERRAWGEAGRRRVKAFFDYRATQREFERFYLDLLGLDLLGPEGGR